MLNADDIKINDESIIPLLGTKKIYLDSGTGYITFPALEFDNFVAKVQQAVPSITCVDDECGAVDEDCDTIAPKLPPLIIQVKQYKFILPG